MTAIAFDFVSKRISTLDVDAASHGAHTDLLTDTLYLSAGTSVVPMFAGAMTTGVFRTPRLVLNSFPKFALARVEGPFTSAVIRLYADGILFHTTAAITTLNPVRLPPKMLRELEVEIESTSRITQVVLASSAEELRAL